MLCLVLHQRACHGRLPKALQAVRLSPSHVPGHGLAVTSLCYGVCSSAVGLRLEKALLSSELQVFGLHPTVRDVGEVDVHHSAHLPPVLLRCLLQELQASGKALLSTLCCLSSAHGRYTFYRRLLPHCWCLVLHQQLGGRLLNYKA